MDSREKKSLTEKATKLMGRVNNTEFVAQVGTILTKNNGQLSVYLTQKRLTASLESTEDKINDLSSNVAEYPPEYAVNEQKYPVLVRISLGDKKTKISTVVEPENLDSFWTEYSQALKNGFIGLRRKEKKKAKRSKKL